MKITSKKFISVILTVAMLLSISALMFSVSAAPIALGGNCGGANADDDTLQWTLDTGTGVFKMVGEGTWSDKAHFQWDDYKQYIKKAIARTGVTNIGAESFSNCTNLQAYILPQTLVAIGDYAFAATPLTSIVIPDSVKTIGENAFAGCESLANVTLPASLEKIETRTFSMCKSLTNLVVPANVTAIGDYAFSSCTSLQGLTLSYKVTSVGTGALHNCTACTDVYIFNNACTIGAGAILPSVTIHCADDSLAKVYADANSNPVASLDHTCTGGHADCSNKAVCELCGNIYGEFGPHFDGNGDNVCDLCGAYAGITSEDGDNALSLIKGLEMIVKFFKEVFEMFMALFK